jgi:hypothetical protein
MSDPRSAQGPEAQGSIIGSPGAAAQESKSLESAPQEPNSSKSKATEPMRAESSAEARPPPSRGGGTRPWWKMYRTSLILGVIGLAMLPASFFLYPRTRPRRISPETALLCAICWFHGSATGQDPRRVDPANTKFLSGSCLELAKGEHQSINSARSASRARVFIGIMNDILCYTDGSQNPVTSLNRRRAFGYKGDE